MPILEWRLPITLPSPNNQEHWGTRHSRNRLIKTYLGLLWDNTPVKPELPLVITITRIASKELDSHDNLQSACKGTVDALASLWLPKERPGMADADTRFTWRYAQAKGKRKGIILIRVECPE